MNDKDNGDEREGNGKIPEEMERKSKTGDKNHETLKNVAAATELEKSQVLASNKVIDELRQSLNASIQENEKNSTKLATLSSEKQSAIGERDELARKYEGIISEKEEWSRQADSLQKLLSVAINEKATLLSELEQEKSEHTASKKQLEDLHKSLNAAMTEQDSLSSKLTSLSSEKEEAVRERDELASQYQGLMEKLSYVKTMLGNKLKEEAEELDNTRAQNQELIQTIESLKNELIMSHEDLDRTQRELENLRTGALEAQERVSREGMMRETFLQELQIEKERLEREREEWETMAIEEGRVKEELIDKINLIEKDMETLREEMERLERERCREEEAKNNLQVVLEEFQASKDMEIKDAMETLTYQLSNTKNQLLQVEKRAEKAELELSRVKGDAVNFSQIEKELKEKNLLIGKLRHEAVILNEHLTEAMRRLKRDNSENNVDRRLVTNLLITFVNLPRGDTKRFEILQLMSAVLQWTSEQKEQVGLIRRGTSRNTTAGPLSDDKATSWGKPGWSPVSAGANNRYLDGGSKESFSDAWINFLLKEATEKERQEQSQ